LRALHAEYLCDGSIQRVAARHQVHKRRLAEMFHAAGLKIEKQWPVRPPPPAAQIRAWHREYLGGTRLKVLGEKYHHTAGDFSRWFREHGLEVRAIGWNGKAWLVKTEAEITALIETVAARPRPADGHTLKVPAEIAQDWKARWSLAQRADFIRRLRARMALPNDAPTTPFSANVEPFDYGSERAWKIVNAANAGRPSRHWTVRIFPSAQGVIWRGQLWFWIRDSGGRNRGSYDGSFVRSGDSKTRPHLHREIYESVHGPIPRAHVVRFRDGNFNNLDPENLYLQSRADEASENRRNIRIKKTRALTAALLQRHERKQTHEHPDDKLIQQVGARSAAPGRSARRGLSVTAGAA
jgi:hypothetical protein